MPADCALRVPRTPANILLFTRALCLVAASRAALTLLPFRLTRRIAARLAAKRPRLSPRLSPLRSSISPDQFRWAVQSAARRVPGATCLTQSLALHIFLRRAGHPSLLQIGVARSPGMPFRAHAWVESGGRILLGALPDLSAFSPLPQIHL